MVSWVGQKLPLAPNSTLNPLTIDFGVKRFFSSDSSRVPSNGNLPNDDSVLLANFLYKLEILVDKDGVPTEGVDAVDDELLRCCK